VQLKAELEAARVTGVPIPESIDDLASSIEQIVECTTKKGTHLATKVKIICETILTDVFDGKCLAYLMDRTFRQIQGENPYRRAIEIAKIIDLSGSLTNLSGYHTLRRGILNVRFQENQLKATRDMGNILFQPENLQERHRFSQEFINHDLRILGLLLIGNLETRRSRLEAVLCTFEDAAQLEGTLEHGNYAGAFIRIRQAVPCILHLENCCGEKFLKMLFLEG
jgi:hypothetical protein